MILEVEQIGHAIFRALREMDAQSTTGLCNYVSCSPFAGKKGKEEAAITWGVTNALRVTWQVEQCEHRYPQGSGRCDRVIELRDKSRLWLEVKLAWRSWFYGIVKHNNEFIYSGYLGGAHHSHSVCGDFRKLELIGSDYARYVALLLVGFDRADGKMADDMAELMQREGLLERGWHLLIDAWPTKQSDECWHRCWFGWREVAPLMVQ
jgi:hypothetical protein